MAEMMVSRTPAMAEMTAMMPEPRAETMEPYGDSETSEQTCAYVQMQ